MEKLHWMWELGHQVFGDVGIIASLIFAGLAAVSEAKTRRISNYLAITSSHKDLLEPLYKDEDLSRIEDRSADLKAKPITQGEQAYVNVRIQHIFSYYRAMRDDLMIKQDGFERDVRDFISLPIPRAVWEKIKQYQNLEFVKFVDNLLS